MKKNELYLTNQMVLYRTNNMSDSSECDSVDAKTHTDSSDEE